MKIVTVSHDSGMPHHNHMAKLRKAIFSSSQNTISNMLVSCVLWLHDWLEVMGFASQSVDTIQQHNWQIIPWSILRLSYPEVQAGEDPAWAGKSITGIAVSVVR